MKKHSLQGTRPRKHTDWPDLWRDRKYVDLWSAVHFTAGVNIGLLLVFPDVSFIWSVTICLILLIFWEIVEINVGIYELWQNRVVDIIIGLAGFFPAYFAGLATREELVVVLLVMLLPLLIYLNIKGISAYFQNSERAEKKQEQEVENLQNYFKKQYKKDTRNKEIQSWKNYWHWVERFYLNRLFVSGWLDLRYMLTLGKEKTDQEKIKDKMDSLGRQIAAEWAKEREFRKIDSNDTREWIHDLQQAKRENNGAGKILSILDHMEKKVSNKLNEQ